MVSRGATKAHRGPVKREGAPEDGLGWIRAVTAPETGALLWDLAIVLVV